MNRLPLAAILAALLAAAAIAAGCGSEDVAKEASGFNEAIEQCREEAEKIEDDEDRRLAEEACDAAESGDSDDLRDAAKDQCLDAARQTSDREARREAEEACNRIEE
jgi:hypothetical protein